MSKKTTYLIVTIFISLLAFTSCENGNKGYREYYNVMGNNPVQVVPWLIDIRKSLDKIEAKISWYKLDREEYYVVQSFLLDDDGGIISPYAIYLANDKEKIVYFESENILTVSEDESDYNYFIENAILVDLLWSNQRRYSTIE